MNLKQEYEKNKELSARTIDAILIGFKKNIYEQYTIPDKFNLQEYLSLLINNPKDKIKLKKRVKEGIMCAIAEYYSEDNPSKMDLAMSSLVRDSPFERKWFPWIGTMYSFKPGEYEKANTRAISYFTKDEMNDFYSIHRILEKSLNDSFVNISKK